MINNENDINAIISIPKDLKIKLEVIAKSDRQSLDNLIISVLDNYVESEFDND